MSGCWELSGMAFQTRPNHQIETVEWPQRKFLPSAAEFAYDWLTTKGYLGNVRFSIEEFADIRYLALGYFRTD
jgi:hypothetical protein